MSTTSCSPLVGHWRIVQIPFNPLALPGFNAEVAYPAQNKFSFGVAGLELHTSL